MRRASMLVLLLGWGCAPAPTTDHWAADAARADEAGLWIASISALLVVPGNLTPRPTPEWTARDAAMAAFDGFGPSACVVPHVSGATITYALTDCAGSFGLVHATGHLTVTYVQSTMADHTEFDASSSDLVLNGQPLQFTAHASVVYDSAMQQRTIVLTSDASGVGPAGTALTRHGTQTARWQDSWGCLFVDTGDDALTVAGASWQSSIHALTFCVGECPMSGGAVTWMGEPGALDLAYGGTPLITWTAPDAPTATGMLLISCGS